MGKKVHPSIQTANRLFAGLFSYKIPPYQREYQWKSDRWQNFWTDLGLLTHDSTTVPPHFLGLILFDRSLTAGVGDAEELLVIDGQQRIVTLMLARAASRDHWQEKRDEERSRPDPLWFLTDEAEAVPRLVPQEADRQDLERVMSGQWREWYRSATSKKQLQSSRVLHAYVFFRLCMWLGKASFAMQDLEVPCYRRGQTGLSAEEVWQSNNFEESLPETQVSFEDVVRATKRLQFLQVNLEHTDEDAATIFDSLNAHQSPLEQWDFVRNLLFIRLTAEDAQSLFDDAWDSVQARLRGVKWENKRSEARDAFLYDYLISVGESRYQGPINQSRTANQLRHRMNRIVGESHATSIRQFIEEDLLFAARRWPVAVGFQDAPIGASTGYSRELLDSIHTSTQISSGPPFPVILNILVALDQGHVNEGAALRELRALETLLVRMVLASRPFSPLRAMTQQILERVGTGAIRRPLDAVLLDDPYDGRLMPTDSDVRESVRSNSYYVSRASGRQLAAILRGVERELSGSAAHHLPYGTEPDAWTVEHILPQSALTGRAPAWSGSIPSAPRSRQALLDQVHHLGNLTLLTNRANSYLKNKGFEVKKTVFSGSDRSCPMPHLAINDSVIGRPSWSSRTIKSRGSDLADLILQRWSLH